MDASTAFITNYLSDIWRIFYSTPTPFFNLTCADLVLGVFVVRFIIKVLRFIFVPDMSGSKDKGSAESKGEE